MVRVREFVQVWQWTLQRMVQMRAAALHQQPLVTLHVRRAHAQPPLSATLALPALPKQPQRSAPQALLAATAVSWRAQAAWVAMTWALLAGAPQTHLQARRPLAGRLLGPQAAHQPATALSLQVLGVQAPSRARA